MPHFSDYTQHTAMSSVAVLPNIPNPSDYDVSIQTGFLPPELPLEALSSPYYAQWETIAKNLNGYTLSRRLRGVVDKMPILSTHHLRTEPEWRRANSLLAFIAHSYIWGGDKPMEVRLFSHLSLRSSTYTSTRSSRPVSRYLSLQLVNTSNFLLLRPTPQSASGITSYSFQKKRITSPSRTSPHCRLSLVAQTSRGSTLSPLLSKPQPGLPLVLCWMP
jgi:hypothetical protein